jgi:hypothetical protein
MYPIVIIKLVFTFYLLNLLLVSGGKYIWLALQIVPENEIKNYYKDAWKHCFKFLVSLFSLILIWFPDFIQKDFYSNPIPTFVFIIVVCFVFATIGANSARKNSISANTIKKILSKFDDK